MKHGYTNVALMNNINELPEVGMCRFDVLMVAYLNIGYACFYIK